ncbi:hypothetical protein NE235_35840 [Actinoallomurus spadix]|uniref:Uncharacterized protein n=1 Tax=Actinoallomurus spadix TaxID=79912 RepID=A0ABP3GCB5_9ACTN|nr:hypothetical protein [Actinoallomurus spadix]MCO5991501.1 hypothetical protein [Actinoallomurus spadix]
MSKPSPDEEANIAYLKLQRAREAELAKLRAKLARLEHGLAILQAANRVARARIERRAAKAERIRTAIDRRIGRHTLDVIIFGLIAAAWWFQVIDRLIQARGR